MAERHEPTGRQLVGIFVILGWIVIWSVIIASFSTSIGVWPVLVQAVFYLIVGLIWIAPLKPLLAWMETGRFRRPPDA